MRFYYFAFFLWSNYFAFLPNKILFLTGYDLKALTISKIVLGNSSLTISLLAV